MRAPELFDELEAADILEVLDEPRVAAFFNRRQLEGMRAAVLAATIWPTAAAELKHRNFWIAMEFHWRRRLGQRGCEKRVSLAWLSRAGVDLTPHQVTVIASRRKAEFERRFGRSSDDLLKTIEHIRPLFSKR
jgi:hypothetical protein